MTTSRNSRVFRPIYGYHSKMVKFWKIEFYNPMIIRKYDAKNDENISVGLIFRAADLLLAGAVMNQEFQPHEAHVPFNLQVHISFYDEQNDLLVFVSFLLITTCMEWILFSSIMQV